MLSSMTHQQILGRSGLTEIVRSRSASLDLTLIRGDLRRFETDQRDENHLARYAHFAGVTSEQAQNVLDLFFGFIPMPIDSDGMTYKRLAKESDLEGDYDNDGRGSVAKLEDNFLSLKLSHLQARQIEVYAHLVEILPDQVRKIFTALFGLETLPQLQGRAFSYAQSR